MSLGLANVIVDGAGNRTFCCCSPMTKTIINSTDWDYSIDSTNLNAKIIKDCWRTGQDLIGSSAGCIHQGQTPNPSYTQTVHTTVTRTFASNVSAASVSFVGGGLYIFSTTDLFDDVGKIGLKKKPHNIKMNTPHKRSPMGFPETRFALLDTSGSMREDVHGGNNVGRSSIIPWGDESKYHYGVLAFYGLVEYLKQNHLLNQTSISSGNFSDETRIRKGLENAKRNILSPQFSGTRIEKDKLKDIFEGKNGLVFTISDGEVENWSSIRDNFIKKSKEHAYFHLQIGKSSSERGSKMTEDLERAGLPVVNIKSANDLAQKIIDLTDNQYRGN